MKNKPVLYALGASAYIVLGTTVMNFVSESLKDKPDTFFAPVVFLSILTLSVAVMAFLFFYQPILLLIDGKKKEAIKFFAKTVGVFAVITSISLILLFSGLI